MSPICYCRRSRFAQTPHVHVQFDVFIPTERELFTELRRLRRYERAVVSAWKQSRPVEWDEAKHLANPYVNCIGDDEKAIARLAAASLKRSKEVRR